VPKNDAKKSNVKCDSVAMKERIDKAIHRLLVVFDLTLSKS